MNLEDLTFTICGDEARSYADSVFLPVDVTDKEGKHILRHEVALRAEFYNDLRTLPDWIDQLHKICRSRTERYLNEHTQTTKIAIEDKLALFDAPPLPVLPPTGTGE